MTGELFDSHTHLGMGSQGQDVAGVIARALSAGVTRMVAIGCLRETLAALDTVILAQTYPGVFASLGVHPHDAKHGTHALLEKIEEVASLPEVVAIGEMGLDYHYMRSPMETQLEVFRSQLRLAKRVDKPVVLHLREATADALAILTEEGIPARGGIVHCYSEGPEDLEAFLDLGLHISFSGIVTFPAATAVQEAARLVPQDRLLVETDAPYLAPIPHRGKTNEAAYLVHTATRVAALRDVPLADLARQTTENALRLFDIVTK